MKTQEQPRYSYGIKVADSTQMEPDQWRDVLAQIGAKQEHSSFLPKPYRPVTLSALMARTLFGNHLRAIKFDQIYPGYASFKEAEAHREPLWNVHYLVVEEAVYALCYVYSTLYELPMSERMGEYLVRCYRVGCEHSKPTTTRDRNDVTWRCPDCGLMRWWNDGD
jgi:hypothetical protein